ncbi:MAG TPA: hypothetical protein VFE45_15585, partial [Coriobacteriia bacterium]|nr:hypothetical protein [Coriobacteriia bacterium]
EDSERRPDSVSRLFDPMLGRTEYLPSGFSASPPEWQPTPLGERVLDYLTRPDESPTTGA